MQDKRFSSAASLAPNLACQTTKKKKQELIAASALIVKYLQAIFTSAPGPGASLLGHIVCLLQVFVHHWIFQLIARVVCFPFYNWQAEEDGVMGGHTRRSKQSAKSSSTVLCDSSASLEDWKQQIKVKGSIPANQQRLTFASQRLIKQPIALTNFSPNRQWQIVVDASIEELCKDLGHWQATLQSKNTSAELLQPLVLKETDELASNLHSRTADELREIGVPCNVFFLSFDKWILTGQSGIIEKHTSSNRQPRGLDIKIDEEFRRNIYLINLFGDLNGIHLSMPLSYVMNGSQLATKLFLVEQTAQYREKQKQRYQQFSALASKDLDAENAGESIEVNCWSSHLKDYILDTEQNCEYTTIISKDHHRLRCIVFPVITIPLSEVRSSEELPSFYLFNGDLKETIREPTSNVLALPSTSKSEVESNFTARNIVEEIPACAAPCYPTQKDIKKKKKKKARKVVKENLKKPTHVKTREAKLDSKASFSCEGVAMKHLQEELATVDTVKHSYPEDVTEVVIEDEGQCLVSNEPEHGDIGSKQLIRDLKDLSLAEMEDEVSSSKQSPFSCNLSLNSDQQHVLYKTLSSGQEMFKENITDSPFHNCAQVMDVWKDQNGSLGISKSGELVELHDASLHTETSVSCRTDTDLSDEYNFPGQRRVDSVEPSLATGADSGRHSSISPTGDMMKFKESLDNELRDRTQNIVHREVIGNYNTNSFSSPNERWEHAGSYTRSNPDSQDCLPYRSRVHHNSFSGFVPVDSRSSAPFWRHQRNDFHSTSHSWSTKPRLARPDYWSADKGLLPASRQFRNIPAWEQLPDLRQPSSGSRFPNQWDQFDEPWSVSSKGQSYSSFNMQQRKFGKSNKISQKYSDKWPLQGIPNGTVPPNMKSFTVLPHTSNVSSIPRNVSVESYHSSDAITRNFSKDGKTSTKQGLMFGVGSQCKAGTVETSMKVAIEPCVTSGSTSATNGSSCPPEFEKSALQPPNSEVVEHVCNILRFVNASCEAWGAYEQVVSMTGKALCEFEMVAKAVAPAFKASTSLQCWELTGCSCGSQVAGISRSKISKQVADVRLSTLWQWYEEPSCYGLKVKLSESSKRTGNQLQAFFVPYLSGIQLFGWSNRKRTTGSDTVAAQGPLGSTFLSQPIFSLLLPKSKADDDKSYNEVTRMQSWIGQKALESKLDGNIRETETTSSSGRHCNCDVELLYEFFEAEKPQQRKPLIDRIEELVSSPDHVLNSAKIDDLHPSSWFAVAWYPIYTIPDETFRSAFLTYHCLSSLQSTCSESTNASQCTHNCMKTITAPVIGLMSYNAQMKDWFSLSPSCSANSSDVLQQYLAKLEMAAACMARGSCHQSSSFKHADFSFFKSRGRMSMGVLRAFKHCVRTKVVKQYGYMRTMKGGRHAFLAIALLGCKVKCLWQRSGSAACSAGPFTLFTLLLAVQALVPYLILKS